MNIHYEALGKNIILMRRVLVDLFHDSSRISERVFAGFNVNTPAEIMEILLPITRLIV